MALILDMKLFKQQIVSTVTRPEPTCQYDRAVIVRIQHPHQGSYPLGGQADLVHVQYHPGQHHNLYKQTDSRPLR